MIQMSGQQAHAAIDVVTHATRRNNSVRQLGRHDAPDGKTIALMDIGHGQGIFDNSG